VLDTVSPVLPASFLGLPAVSVPCAPAGARAHGVQVIGHRYEDRRCLDIARIIENG
jgi:Asp-tRNA(Asn)/Glu-tRNA(Gln) amidotransferase A subunit family amidase